MIDKAVGKEISRIFREMGRALTNGTWDKATYLRLRSEARTALPEGYPTPTFLLSGADPSWLEKGEIEVVPHPRFPHPVP